MDGFINLKSLTLDELSGVVNLYPWFGNARRELCARMAKLGGDISMSMLSEAALYVSSRKALREIIRTCRATDCSDKDAQTLLKSYIEQKRSKEDEEIKERKILVVGGDYFSQSQYDKIRKSEDGVFSGFDHEVQKSRKGDSGSDDSLAFYTETLAQIYAEQGYFDQAKKIYSKLILAYPEKNAYFAALIQKLEQNS